MQIVSFKCLNEHKKKQKKKERSKKEVMSIFFWASFCSLSSAYAAIGENDYSFFLVVAVVVVEKKHLFVYTFGLTTAIANVSKI